MDYTAQNKRAWEEAFENRSAGWGEDIVPKAAGGGLAFFQPDMKDAIGKHEFRDRTVAQFCCNNGRELLSLVRSTGARKGVGFDIAENQVAFAAKKAAELHAECEFVATNILDIGEEYRGCFDAALITIGALCWFRDLGRFFGVVSGCLKKGGFLLMNEQHPVTNTFGLPGDENYSEGCPACMVNSYFSKEWRSNDGMSYITQKTYRSETFIDYTHPLGEIMGAIIGSGMAITGFREYDYDISDSFGHLDGKGIPLSYILEAVKG